MYEKQMELFNEGGLKDEGGSVDPVSGNDVPIGSTKEEVRDDIPAMVSEGEFVFPADVVRYIGLNNLMQLRQDAKMGLKKMEAMGQMGNSEEATLPDDMPFDMADLVIIEGSDEPKEMAQGGVIKAQTGTFVVPKFDPRNQDVRQYKNEAGEIRNIPFFDNAPAYPIPEGFFPVGTDIPTEEKTPETVAPVEDGGGGGDRDRPPVNAFTEAGSWTGSPLDMYIKEAKKVSTYGNVAAGVGAAFNPLIGGFMAVAVKNEKRKILATIDDRIKQAKTTEEKNELEDIKDRLTNPERKGILGQIVKEVVAPITNALGITDPKQAEVVSEVAKQTATGDVNEPDEETKTTINVITDQMVKGPSVGSIDSLGAGISTTTETDDEIAPQADKEGDALAFADQMNEMGFDYRDTDYNRLDTYAARENYLNRGGRQYEEKNVLESLRKDIENIKDPDSALDEVNKIMNKTVELDNTLMDSSNYRKTVTIPAGEDKGNEPNFLTVGATRNNQSGISIGDDISKVPPETPEKNKDRRKKRKERRKSLQTLGKKATKEVEKYKASDAGQKAMSTASGSAAIQRTESAVKDLERGIQRGFAKGGLANRK